MQQSKARCVCAILVAILALVGGLGPRHARACDLTWVVERAELVLAAQQQTPPIGAGSLVPLPDALGRRDDSIAWYRFAVPASEPGTICGILIERTNSSTAVYLNGEWLGQKGALHGPEKNTWSYPLYVHFSSGKLAASANTVSVGVRVKGSLFDGIGRISVGPDAELRARYERLLFFGVQIARASTVFSGFLCLVFGALAAALRDPVYRWFSLATAFCTVSSLSLHWADPPLEYWQFMPIAAASTCLMCSCMGLLALRLIDSTRRGLELGVGAWSFAVVTAAVVLDGPAFERIAGLLRTGSLGIAVAGMLAIALDRRGAAPAQRVVLATTGFLLVAIGVHDVGLQWLKQIYGRGYERGFLFPYFGLVMLLGFGSTLLLRFLAVYRRAERANLELAAQIVAKRAELEKNFAQMRALERTQLIAGERDRLSSEMHDGIGRQLVALLTLTRAGEPKPAEVTTRLRAALDDMRLVIHALDPSTRGIPAVLAGLRARLEPRLRSHGMHFRWQVQDIPDMPKMGPWEVLQILRVAHDAMTNAMRHSGGRCLVVATGVVVSARARAFVEISDDGKGIPPPQLDRPTFGRLRERASLLDGEVEIRTGDQGTAVRLWIPLDRWS